LISLLPDPNNRDDVLVQRHQALRPGKLDLGTGWQLPCGHLGPVTDVLLVQDAAEDSTAGCGEQVEIELLAAAGASPAVWLSGPAAVRGHGWVIVLAGRPPW
jgi:hypothetical protein